MTPASLVPRQVGTSLQTSIQFSCAQACSHSTRSLHLLDFLRLETLASVAVQSSIDSVATMVGSVRLGAAACMLFCLVGLASANVPISNPTSELDA